MFEGCGKHRNGIIKYAFASLFHCQPFFTACQSVSPSAKANIAAKSMHLEVRATSEKLKPYLEFTFNFTALGVLCHG